MSLTSYLQKAELIASITPEDADVQQALSMLWSVFPELKLSNVQIIVFVESWKGKTYQQISESEQYDADYLKDVGHRLWKQLSEAAQEPLSKHNFRSVLKQKLQAINPPPSSSLKRLDEGDAPFNLPIRSDTALRLSPVTDLRGFCSSSSFCGRHDDLNWLEKQVVHHQNQLVGIFGFAGMGKTALVMQLIPNIEQNFEFIIGRSLRNASDFSSFLISILQTIREVSFINNIPSRVEDQVEILIDYLSQKKCLLILGDWSSLLEPQNSLRTYNRQHHCYGLFLRRVSESLHQSCIIITSRETPNGLAFKYNDSFPVNSLYLKGLNREEGITLLRKMNLSATDTYLEKLWFFYSGNPYALKIASKTINDFFDGDVCDFLSQKSMIYGDIRYFLKKQIERLSAIEKDIVFQFSMMNDGLEFRCYFEELQKKLSQTKYETPLIEAIESLYHRSFIRHENNKVTMLQIIREYVLSMPESFTVVA